MNLKLNKARLSSTVYITVLITAVIQVKYRHVDQTMSLN